MDEIFQTTKKFQPTWPREVYADWLNRGLGTLAQQERYKAALIWYEQYEEKADAVEEMLELPY